MLQVHTNKNAFTCEFCDKLSYRKLSGTNIKRGIANRWCSMTCRSGAAYARTSASSPCYGLYCRFCTQPFVSRRAKAHCTTACQYADRAAFEQEADIAAHSTNGRVVSCADCTAQFCPVYGASLAKRCVPCAKAQEKQWRAINRVARKARQRGVSVEAVNPITVFDRDRWHCKLCGVSTPRRLRGTYHDRAPELDHIIPIAKGGEHSYLNTQCSCRKCNAEKSDRPLGQMLMFG